MSLVFDHVSFHYPGGNTGLDDISCEIRSGELVACIGPSGSGKTTLLKLVAGLNEGHSGSIRLDGSDLAQRPVHQRNIGVVFQNYALFRHLDVLDNIAYGLRLRGMARTERLRRAQELLDMVGLGNLGQRAIGQLSGGQQQRVALARALAINPAALLLDEPLSALDASVRGQLRDHICRLQRQFNATTLLVTHDQEEALTMADRVAVLKDGRLLQFATPQTLYEAPVNRAVAEFVGLSSILEGRVSARDRVDVGFAELAVPTGARAPGQTVHVLCRPEHFVADPPADHPNRLPGTLTTQRYLGSLYHYDFVVAGAPRPLLVEGRVPAQTALGIAPHHLRLLDD